MTTRPTRALAFLALAAAGVLVPACSGTQPATDRAPAQAAAPFEVDHEAWAGLGYRWEWTSRPPRTKGGVIAFADAYEDLVVVQDTGAMVSVIEAPTGRLRWNIQVAETNTRFLGNTRHRDSLFVTNETELFEFDMRTGNTLARHGVHDIATTRPVFFDHRAVFATAAGRLVCLDTRRDLRLWEYQFQGQINTTPLKIDDERVAGISTLGDLRTLTVEDARTVSSARIAGGPDDWLVTDGEILFIASTDQSVYAFDIADGRRLWRLRTSAPVTVEPVLVGDALIVTTADTGLAAIDSVSGEIRWSNPKIGGWVVATNGGDLMVWTGLELLRVDADRGDLIARARFEGLSGLRADTLENGDIYAVSADGAVARFSPR